MSDSASYPPSTRRTVTRRFRGLDFTISVGVNAEILSVDIRQLGGTQWAGKFTARFIEEITQRTGSFKSFPVFIKMLLSALNGDSDSLSLDIMASEDLQLIRTSSFPVVASAQDKRYLIITYSSEYDKVHYPLALAHVAASLAPALAPTSGCTCGLAQANAELQRQISDLTARESRTRAEFERLVGEFEDERNRMMDERSRVASLNSAERAELAALRESNKWFESEITNLKDSRTKLLSKHKLQTEELQHEISALRHNERQLKLKLKQTEQDLALSKNSSRSRPPAAPKLPVTGYHSPLNRSTFSNASASSRVYSRTPSPSSRTAAASAASAAGGRHQPPSQVPSPRRPDSSASSYRAGGGGGGRVPPSSTGTSGWTMSPRIPPPRRPDTAASNVSDVLSLTRSPSRGHDRSLADHHQLQRQQQQPQPPPAAATRGVDIKDIDARLTALQNFLKQSKLAGL